jgi:hypothetical protein
MGIVTIDKCENVNQFLIPVFPFLIETKSSIITVTNLKKR